MGASGSRNSSGIDSGWGAEGGGDRGRESSSSGDGGRANNGSDRKSDVCGAVGLIITDDSQKWAVSGSGTVTHAIILPANHIII